jgi:hypothetical protein
MTGLRCQLMTDEELEANEKIKYNKKMNGENDYFYNFVVLKPIKIINPRQSYLENKKTLLQKRLFVAQETNRQLNEENQLLIPTQTIEDAIQTVFDIEHEEKIMRLNKENRLLQKQILQAEESTKQLKEENQMLKKTTTTETPPLSMIDLFHGFCNLCWLKSVGWSLQMQPKIKVN